MNRNLTSLAVWEVPIQQARLVFQHAMDQMHVINSFYPNIQASAAKLEATAKEAPQLQVILSLASTLVESVSVTLDTLEAQLQKMANRTVDLRTKIHFVNTTHNNKSQLIEDSLRKVQQAAAKLNGSPDPNTEVLNATSIMNNLRVRRSDMHQLFNDSLSNKIDKLMEMPSHLYFALEVENSSSTYRVPQRSINSTHRNEIKMAMRTNSSRGLLFVMARDPNELSSSKLEKMTEIIVFYIKEGKVHVLVNLGDGSFVITHPQRVDNNKWHIIYFTRNGLNIYLSVGEKHGTVVSLHVTAGNPEILFSTSSAIYIGGLPLSFKDANKYGDFIGVVDRLIVDQTPTELWSPKDCHGTRLFAVSPYFEMCFPPNGAACSFFGLRGFLQQKMGDFSISNGLTEVHLQFRSLKSSGMIMAVTDEDWRYAFSLYLLQGKVYFRFEVALRNGITLHTIGSTYSDGKWYQVVLTHTRDNATLTVKPSGSNIAPDTQSVYTGPIEVKKGVVITFGAPNPHSNVQPPVSDPFIGDLKNIKLSNSSTNSLEPRYCPGPLVLSHKGVTNTGVTRGKIEPGVRFYGYVDDEESFAQLNLGNSEELSSLTFTFKTKEQSGILFYSSYKGQGSTVYLYIALWHGRMLVLLRHRSSLSKPTAILASNATYNNGAWYRVHLKYTVERYSLYVNDSRIFNSNGFSGRLRFTGPLFVGGIPNSIALVISTPVTWSFKGGMKHFIVNEREIDLLSGKSEGVSKAGVTPAYVVPLPPPICAASLPPLVWSSDSQMIGFRPQGFNERSYLAFELNAKRAGYFRDSYVVAIEFRAVGRNGLIFYAADDQTNPSQYVSLELNDGRLRYEFSTGHGRSVTTETNDRYFGNGKWYRVYFLRISQFGVLYVLYYEYKNKVGPSSGVVPPMNIKSPVFLGGLPSSVKVPGSIKQDRGFTGCVRFLSISSANETHTVDLTRPDIRGTGTGSCYSTVQTGSGFNGSAWLKFDKLKLNKDFIVHLEFRTSERDGLLFYMVNGSKEEHGLVPGSGPAKFFFALEQISGQIVLSYNTEVNLTAAWTDPAVGNETKSSYKLCQMSWHTIDITKSGGNITLEVDNHPTVIRAPENLVMEYDLYVGGLPVDMHKRGNPSVPGFKGCIKNLRINNKSLSSSEASQLLHATYGCPLNSEEKRKANA